MKDHGKSCACCSLPSLPAGSIFEICPLCGWQDDVVQNDDPDFVGGANALSLNEYHRKWEKSHHRNQTPVA